MSQRRFVQLNDADIVISTLLSDSTPGVDPGVIPEGIIEVTDYPDAETIVWLPTETTQKQWNGSAFVDVPVEGE
jgi:hypothetical protein